MNDWYSIASKAEWRSLVDIRESFPHADSVDGKTVFNIKGNDYRLVVTILYDKGIIYIKDLLTHSTYDRNKWRK
ncbi:MAG: type II toxin-antitoxin system HigB family toxin [Chloroflexota bacterium]